MVEIDPKMSMQDLMKLAAAQHRKEVEMSDEDKASLIAILKERGAIELEYGEELEVENVRLVHRVTGAVSIYFQS